MPLPPRKTAVAVRRVDVAPDPLAAFEELRRSGPAWLLDGALRRQAVRRRASPAVGSQLRRVSFLGGSPYAIARVSGRQLELTVLRDADPRWPRGRHALSGDPLELLRGLLPPKPEQPAPDFPFAGGAVGYLGYEFAEQLDVHQLHGRDDLGLPDAVLLLVDRLLVCDHEQDRVFACGLGIAGDPARASELAEEAAAELVCEPLDLPDLHLPDAEIAGRTLHGPEEIDPAEYAKAVDIVKEEIAAGNVYQACLTSRACRRFDGDPWSLYRALRRVNPAPFACFLELPEVAVVGSSPERFLQITRDGAVESRPIKGTAPRGRDPLEDEARRSTLADSEKDRAENLMIVDLVRNDLGRVCETGSVHVPELMAIESYATVFQMVSTVRGRLARDRDAFDAVRATFPPGSMTGAPKISAMALLDRLEPVRRTVYSGAIGYFDVFGAADLSVVIRTALVQRGRAYLHAGGGIVADSDPVAEYREAQSKLSPLFAALADAEDNIPPLAIP